MKLKTLTLAIAASVALFGADVRAQPQPNPDVVARLAPTGKLRVGLLMLTYFANEDPATGNITGVMPDLGQELAKRLGVPYEGIKIKNPAEMIEGFRGNKLDVTFIGITADRAAAFDYGPVVLDLQTTFLVPAESPIKAIGEVDRPGTRIVVPQRSAQEAKLKAIITQATMIPVPVENPRTAVEMILSGQADVFSHVVPMLVNAQASLPGSRILPGSYYNVPTAIGYQKGQPDVVIDFTRRFVSDVKQSGFVQKSLDAMGEKAKGVVVAPEL
ncbi:MAG: transporter substrate-binding domain-containing protein [Pseudomonadota bacterium]